MRSYSKQYLQAVSNPLPEMAEYFAKENEYLSQLVNKNSVVLDVGCGNGRTMKFLAPLVKRVVGIDWDAAMIQAAERNLTGIKNVELVTGDFWEYDVPEQFDLVLASYNLLGAAEISPRQRLMLLNKMINHVKTGGHVIASVWSTEGIDFTKKYYPSIGIRVLDIKGNNVITDIGTLRRFSEKELKALAESTSKIFEIIKLNDIFYLMDVNV